MHKTHRFFFIILAIAVLVVVSLACGSTTTTSEPPSIGTVTSTSVVMLPTRISTATTEPSATQQPVNSPTPTETPSPTSKLGDIVTGYGYALSGIAVKDPVTENGFGFCTVMSNERILAVQIVAENISGDAVYAVNPFYFSLVDNEGFVYESAQCHIDGVEGMKDIQPGQKDRRWLTFIVPIGSTAASIQWSVDSSHERILMAGLTE